MPRDATKAAPPRDMLEDEPVHRLERQVLGVSLDTAVSQETVPDPRPIGLVHGR